MRTSGLVFLLTAMHTSSLGAQEQGKFTFHGRGESPVALIVTLSAGYNIDEKNAVIAEPLRSGVQYSVVGDR